MKRKSRLPKVSKTRGNSETPSYSHACKLHSALVAEQVEEWKQFGKFLGDLTADYLDQIGVTNCELPYWFAIDLTVALLLAWWERVGFIALLPEQLPCSSSLQERIIREAQDPQQSLTKKPDLLLLNRVFSLHTRFLAQNHSGLNVQFLLDQPEQEALIEAFAKFLIATSNLTKQNKEQYAKTKSRSSTLSP